MCQHRCFTNIATGSHEQTRQVIPAAPALVQLLSAAGSAESSMLQEQAAYAIGNIAGDSAEFRQLLHQVLENNYCCKIQLRAYSSSGDGGNNNTIDF